MLQESEIVPYHCSLPPGERVVILAPHPDDETLGCGGAIRLLVAAKKKIKVIFLTSGDKADPSDSRSRQPLTPERGRSVGGLSPTVGKDKGEGGFSGREHITEYSLMREREAEEALGVLGVFDYEFLRFPDRGIHGSYDDLRTRLIKAFGEFMPDTVYAPSMVEVNPDHRAASVLALELQRSCALGASGREDLRPAKIVFYEVATPLRPNILVDVTSVYDVKNRAVKKYKSQLRLLDYLGHIAALNTIRALTVSGTRYVEAFWLIDRPLSDEEMSRWLGYREGLKTERKGQGSSRRRP